MSVRVTNFTKMNNILLTLNRRMRNMTKYQEQLATNRRVIHPSDDPTGTNRILTLNGEIALNEQHQRNLDNTQGVLNFTESIIVSIEEVITSARTDAILADSDTITDEERLIISARVDLLLEDLLTHSNSQYAGSYIFSGTNSQNPTFVATRDDAGEIIDVALNPEGASGDIVREIGYDNRITVNVEGEELLMSGGDSDLFDGLIRFRDALRNGDLDEIGSTIDRLDAAYNQVLTQRTFLGAMGQRVMQAQELVLEMAIDYTDDLSRVEDIDYAEAILQYTIEENAYQAALGAASRVIQPTLLDFLG
jgi:flagellar hook-associated protein 3 FlgL